MDHIKEAIEWTRACAYLTFRRYRPLWRAMWVPRAAGTKVAREALLDFWNVYLASTQQGRLSTAQWTNQVKMAASDLTRSWHTEARGFTDLLDWFHGYFINEETVRLWRLWAVVFHKLAREDRHGRPSSDSSHIYLIVQRGVARAWRNEATIDVLAGSCEAKSPDPIERTILRRQPRFVHNICAALPRVLDASRARKAWSLIEPLLSKADRRALLVRARSLAPSIHAGPQEVELPVRGWHRATQKGRTRS
jgi:plasmid stabilization system protein ParE